LFVNKNNGRKEAKSLDGKGDMGEIGDGSMAVLEIECI